MTTYEVAAASVREDDTTTVTATELDSHADSPVVGKSDAILEHAGKTVKVSGFSDSIGKPLQVPVVHAAVMFDDDVTGDSRILVINHALYLDDMEVNLVPPFMLRLAGVEVNECPNFLAKDPTLEHHSINFPMESL